MKRDNDRNAIAVQHLPMLPPLILSSLCNSIKNSLEELGYSPWQTLYQLGKFAVILSTEITFSLSQPLFPLFSLVISKLTGLTSAKCEGQILIIRMGSSFQSHKSQ